MSGFRGLRQLSNGVSMSEAPDANTPRRWDANREPIGSRDYDYLPLADWIRMRSCRVALVNFNKSLNM